MSGFTKEELTKKFAQSCFLVLDPENYVNIKSKLHCVCRQCSLATNRYGGPMILRADRIFANKPCWKCMEIEVSNKFRNERMMSIIQAKKILQSKHLAMVDESQYQGAHKPLHCRCLKCGNSEKRTGGEWLVYITNVAQGHGCPKCAQELHTLKQSKSHSDFVREVMDQNPYANSFKIISKYISSGKKIVCKCLICEETFTKIAETLLGKNGGACHCQRYVRVAKKKAFSHDEFVAKVNAKNTRAKNFNITGQYKNGYSKIECFCLVCKKSFYPVAESLYFNNVGCRRCATSGFNPKKPAHFYLKEISYLGNIKYGFGITNALGIRDRSHSTNLKRANASLINQWNWFFEDGQLALDLENIIKNDNSIQTTGILPIKGFLREAFEAKNLSQVLSYIHATQ